MHKCALVQITYESWLNGTFRLEACMEDCLMRYKVGRRRLLAGHDTNAAKVLLCGSSQNTPSSNLIHVLRVRGAGYRGH
jgi:hypothetical protein